MFKKKKMLSQGKVSAKLLKEKKICSNIHKVLLLGLIVDYNISKCLYKHTVCVQVLFTHSHVFFFIRCDKCVR